MNWRLAQLQHLVLEFLLRLRRVRLRILQRLLELGDVLLLEHASGSVARSRRLLAAAARCNSRPVSTALRRLAERAELTQADHATLTGSELRHHAVEAGRLRFLSCARTGSVLGDSPEPR
jgi:hypothetical protein